MTRAEIIQKVSRDTRLPVVTVDRVVDSLCKNIINAVSSGHQAKLTGFGTFKPVNRKSKKGQDMNTGECVMIPSRSVPKFIPCERFKELTYGIKK